MYVQTRTPATFIYITEQNFVSAAACSNVNAWRCRRRTQSMQRFCANACFTGAQNISLFDSFLPPLCSATWLLQLYYPPLLLRPARFNSMWQWLLPRVCFSDCKSSSCLGWTTTPPNLHQFWECVSHSKRLSLSIWQTAKNQNFSSWNAFIFIFFLCDEKLNEKEKCSEDTKSQ